MGGRDNKTTKTVNQIFPVGGFSVRNLRFRDLLRVVFRLGVVSNLQRLVVLVVATLKVEVFPDLFALVCLKDGDIALTDVDTQALALEVNRGGLNGTGVDY